MKRFIRIIIPFFIFSLFPLTTYAVNDNRGGKVVCKQGNQSAADTNREIHPDRHPADSSHTDVTEPVDPNEIVGTNGYMVVAEGDTVRWVSAEQSLPYTIYFENDPERATASALVVQVRLKLDPLMNPASMGIGSFGFNNRVFAVEGAPLQYQTRLDLTEQMGIYVDVVAGIDITTGEAFWIFSSIDPATGIAPTESNRGFLPVNDSTHRGEGFVNFTIKPRTAQCHTGDTISAQASIVFDGNDAIETNRWLLTLDAQAPASTMQVVHETADSLYIAFSGTDDATGMAAYRLYYTSGSSAYRLAGRYPAGDTTRVATEPNRKYTFFSIGEDHVGNLEPMKDGPDTLYGNTQVQISATVLPAGTATIVGAGTYAEGDTVRLALHAAEGYRLRRWVEGGVSVGTDSMLVFETKESRTLTAEMERVSHTLTIAAASGTSISATRGGMPVFQTVQHQDSIALRLTAQPCTEATLMLNGRPIALDTIIVATSDIALASTATPMQIDTGLVLDTICRGLAYSAHGFNLLGSATSQSGLHEFSALATTASGCDSLTRLMLYVKPSHTITFMPNGGDGQMPPQEVCSGSPEVLSSSAFSREGFYFAGWVTDPAATTADYADGDIIAADTDLTLYALWSSSCVHHVNSRIATVCDSMAWRGTTLAVTGVYADTVIGVLPGGCDSIYRLHLTVNHTTHNDMQIIACTPYRWVDNITYSTDTTRMFSTTNASGCDSIVTLNLTIGHSVTTQEAITACDEWQGFTADTVLTTTYTSATGCDSTHTVLLSINHSTEREESMTVAEADLPLEYEGLVIADSGSYTLRLTTAEGCDSVVHLQVSVLTTGVEETDPLQDIRVYPNPTRGTVTVEAEGILRIEVLDLHGRLISTTEGTNTVDLSPLPSGNYMMRITLERGIRVQKVTRQ